MNQSNYQEVFQNMWHLTYRFGMNATLSKNFYFKGDILQAQERARKHCTIMNYKYIDVYPFLADINKQEYFKLHGREETSEVQEIQSKTPTHVGV